MREICTCSLGGGRRLARQRASSDPTPMNHSNNGRTLLEESEEGRLRLKEKHSLTRHVPDTERDCTCSTGGRVCGEPMVGRFIREKNRMR